MKKIIVILLSALLAGIGLGYWMSHNYRADIDSVSTESSQIEKENSVDSASVSSSLSNPAPNNTQEEAQPEIPAEDPASINGQGHIVILDPGHQSLSDTGQEPDGPGSATTKLRDSGGTQGCTTGIYEYALNLEIGLQLREELQKRGYQVYLTREENAVTLGNIDRAKFAEEHQGEIMLRIHANGSEDSSANGAMTICQTPNNPYQNLYRESRLLSDCVLEAYTQTTGMKKLSVWETDSMAGNNWSSIPVTIIEMGFMTNPADDLNMADPEYQTRMVQGLANGIDLYFQK